MDALKVFMYSIVECHNTTKCNRTLCSYERMGEANEQHVENEKEMETKNSIWMPNRFPGIIGLIHLNRLMYCAHLCYFSLQGTVMWERETGMHVYMDVIDAISK